MRVCFLSFLVVQSLLHAVAEYWSASGVIMSATATVNVQATGQGMGAQAHERGVRLLWHSG
jgi:ABC-type phosphate transport system substrate-binding protein